MSRRQPIAMTWLFTDERLGEGLWQALERVPRGGGVVFRHYATALAQRRLLFRRVRKVARRRGLVLLRGGDAAMPGEMGVHGPGKGRPGSFRSWSAHNRAQTVLGVRAGAAVIFVSPLYRTRSHPGSPVLGPRRAALIGRGLPVPVIALGGMEARRFSRIGVAGFSGWAGIDAWQRRNPHQKRKAVPI